MNTDLSNTKPGDKLCWHDRYHGWRRVTVAKVGKLHITDTQGAKYRINNGRMVGAAGYSIPYVRPITPTIEHEMAIQNAREYIARDWRKLTDEQALAVALAIRAALQHSGGEEE